MKHIKLFENFKLNESLDDNLSHIIKIGSYEMEDGSTIYLDQNFSAKLVLYSSDTPGKYKFYKRKLEEHKTFALLLDKDGRTLIMYDYTDSGYLTPDDETKEQFLSAFNKRFKTECTRVLGGRGGMVW